MSDRSIYDSLFKEAGKLIEGSVNLDGRPLGKPGFFERKRLLKALKLLERAAEIEPPYGAASLFAAKVHERLGNGEGTLRWLQKAQSGAPNNVVIAIELGGALSKQGRLAEAIGVLTAAADTHPSDPRVHSNLGLSLLLSGDTQAAITAFERLFSLEPDRPVNKRLLYLAIDVHEGRKPRPASEDEIVRSLREFTHNMLALTSRCNRPLSC